MPSLQFVITDRMSLISPLNSNGRSIPLMSQICLVDPDPRSRICICQYFELIRILPSISKKVRKTLISNILWLLFDFFYLWTYVIVPKRSNKQKKQGKKGIFCWCLGDHRRQQQNPRSQELDPYRSKMSRIRNTGCFKYKDKHTADKRDKLLNKTATI